MRRFRDWFYKRFLPWETREMYMHEIQNLRERADKAEAEAEELRAYIDGMRYAIKYQRKIEIKNEVANGAEN